MSRKVIVYVAASVDGYIAAPDGLVQLHYRFIKE
jgi:hypothetical protein